MRRTYAPRVRCLSAAFCRSFNWQNTPEVSTYCLRPKARSHFFVCAVLMLGVVLPLAGQEQPGGDGAGNTQAATGGISGRITAPGGQNVASVRVGAVRIFPLNGSLADPPVAYTLTNPQGEYAFSSLTSGSYKICVATDGLGMLDPCLWASNPPLANVAATTRAQLDIQLEAAEWLFVRVEDPDSVISGRQRGPRDQGVFSVFVRTAYGPAEPLQQVSEDQSGRNYRIGVPRGRTVEMVLTGVAVEDESGKLVDRANPPVVQITDRSRAVKFIARRGRN